MTWASVAGPAAWSGAAAAITIAQSTAMLTAREIRLDMRRETGGGGREFRAARGFRPRSPLSYRTRFCALHSVYTETIAEVIHEKTAGYGSARASRRPLVRRHSVRVFPEEHHRRRGHPRHRPH